MKKTSSHHFRWEIDASVRGVLQRAGKYVLNLVEFLGGVGTMVMDMFRSLKNYAFDYKGVIQQFHEIGIRTFSLISLIAIFTGMVFALQFIVGLRRFGLQLYAGQVVGIAIVRELGPVLSALMIASRVGSGIAAELGSMEVSEQILAIRAMGASPIAKLVVPRVLVATIATPILTVIADVIGILGGLFISLLEAGTTARFFIDQIQRTVKVYDFMSGLGKALFFGFFIGCIACYKGLTTKHGTKGVGDSTTQTVVLCSVVIFVSDFFLTKLFLLF